jgi:hypothetical protein
MADKMVKVRVLRGAILLGEKRVEKGHTFDTTLVYAQHLLTQLPNDYEIIKEVTTDGGTNAKSVSGKPATV